MRWFTCIATAVISATLHSGAFAHSVDRNPLSQITNIEDAQIRTPGHRAHAHSSFDLTFRIADTDEIVKLRLEPNHNVLAEGATIHKLGPDGQLESIEIIERSDHRVYKGSAFVQRGLDVEWSNVGWARIVVDKDGEKPVFAGAFRFDSDHHHIQTRKTYESTRLAEDPAVSDAREDVLIIWRDSDITRDTPKVQELKRSLAGERSCHSDALDFNLDPAHPIYNGMTEQNAWDPWGLFKRADDIGEGNGAGVYLANSIGSTSGCPTSRKVALVGIATDCGYTASFTNDEEVRKNIINEMNKASQLYEETFDISLGIQNLTISDRVCPTTELASAKWNRDCDTKLDINAQLNLFSAWRGERKDTNAFWTMLTSCITAPAVGSAWLGQLCVTDAVARGTSNDTSTGANVVAKTSTEWQVIAHEVGHTFGAVHDCDSSTCSNGAFQAQQCCPLSTTTCPAGGGYIMNPSTAATITKFSPCSIGNICSAIGRNSVRTSCLTDNKGVTLITGSQCGNGIVEDGEDCDCGGTDGCSDNKCCNPATCKFNTGCTCDPSNEACCTDTCGFSSNTTVCRDSTGSCDVEEKCTGTAAGCPADITEPNGQACGNKGEDLSCASGQCTSQDAQCRTMMGIYSNNTGNTTYACYNTGCMALCASPDLPANTCYEMKQSYLDGTPCDGGGRCDNGVCSGSSVGGEIKSWIERNRTLFIALVAGIGGLIVIAILSCCIVSYRRRRRIRTAQAAQAAAAASGWGRPPPPPQTRGGGGGYARVPMPQPMTQRDGNGFAYVSGNPNYGPPPSYAEPAAVRYA